MSPSLLTFQKHIKHPSTMTTFITAVFIDWLRTTSNLNRLEWHGNWLHELCCGCHHYRRRWGGCLHGGTPWFIIRHHQKLGYYTLPIVCWMVDFKQRKNNDGNDLVLLPLNGIMRILKIQLGANNCCMHYSCVIPCVKRHLAHNRFMLLLWLKDGADLGGAHKEDKQVSYQTRKGTDNSLIVICWHCQHLQDPF